MIYDIETLPNLGYFWDTYSDRAIPLEFIVQPKSICTIAYKWLGQNETYVLVIDKPYDDLYEKNQQYENEDRLNFINRQRHNFFL